MTGIVYDWNAPVTKTRPIGSGKSQSFIVVFTAEDTPSNGVIKRNYPHRLDENTYAATVRLHEDYTNFESIPNIMRISHGDNLTLLYAQPADPSGVTYPDPDKAAKWF